MGYNNRKREKKQEKNYIYMKIWKKFRKRMSKESGFF